MFNKHSQILTLQVCKSVSGCQQPIVNPLSEDSLLRVESMQGRHPQPIERPICFLPAIDNTARGHTL